jgi:uncharacterized protein (DUF1684 family)
MATSPSGPRPGDVVVARDSATDDYRLQVFRRATQLRFFTREDAVRDATTFAEIHRVDVWYTHDGTLYERAAACRPRRRPASQSWAR